MAFLRDLGAAGALAVGRDAHTASWPAHERVPPLAWLPLGGLAVGAVAALLAARFGDGGAVVAAATLAVALGRPRHRPARVASAVATVLALLATAPAARTLALLVAPMLGRWACVVQCYGGLPAPHAQGPASLAGRVRFREFAIASVSALGTSLVVLDAVGLLVAGACALVTLGLRVAAYRSRGGIDGATLDATGALVEACAFVLLAAIGRVLS